MKNAPQIKTLLLLAGLLQIIWGLVPSASKIVIDQIPVELYIALRWTISGLIFFVFIFLTSKWRPAFNRRTLTVAILGIGGYGLASFGTLYGLKIGGVTNFALMGALNPIITSMVAILVLKERPQRLFFVALPLCVLGLVCLVLGKNRISSWQIAISSSALIIGAAVLEALIFVYSKKLKTHFTAVQYLAIAQVAAAIFMWVLQVGIFQQSSELGNLDSQGWLAALFVSIVACVLCYSLLYWLLNYLDAHKIALFDGLHTISATLAGVVFFGEVLNAPMIAGGAMILLGLIIGNLR